MSEFVRTKTNIIGQRFGTMPKEVAEFFDYAMSNIIKGTHDRILKDWYEIRRKEENGKEHISERNEAV